MSWSKVNKPLSKPLGWWYHKIFCEIGWALRWLLKSYKMYYHHLDKLCLYGFNLYGEPLKQHSLRK
jgi:hypothetical protein